MNEYDFALHFRLGNPNTDPGVYEDRLYEAGCQDALLGIGQQGYIGLDFIRNAKDAVEAVYSAIDNVKSAIPDAELYYISPDIVGISDIAAIMNCSRQNVRMLVERNKSNFPFAINSDANSLQWHLVEVLKWYQSRNTGIDLSLLEVSEFAMLFNLRKRSANLNSSERVKQIARELVGR